MPRWEPNAADRLRETALRLYAERGYEQTTVSDIADGAGLTARTFFRYFGDKREVLFAGSAELEATIVAALRDAPPSTGPMDAVGAALGAGAVVIGQDRDFSRRRREVIESTPRLRERELIKLANLATALADGLRGRGVGEPAASLAAEAGVAVFRVGFDRWVTSDDDRTLGEVMAEALAELKLVTA